LKYDRYSIIIELPQTLRRPVSVSKCQDGDVEVDVYGLGEFFASNKFGGGNKDMNNSK